MSGTLTFYTETLTYWSEAIHNNYINLHLYFDGVILNTFCKFSPSIKDFSSLLSFINKNLSLMTLKQCDELILDESIYFEQRDLVENYNFSNVVSSNEIEMVCSM